MAINKVCIAGNLTRDAELRTVGNPQEGGFVVLNFGVAVNERRRDRDSGEWVDAPVFVDCSLFGTRAEKLSRWMTKGRKVMLSGRLRYSTYTKDDERRSKLSVVVDDLEFGDSHRGDAESSQQPVTDGALYDEDVPF